MKKIQERWRGADINYEWELREVFKDIIEHAYFESKGKLSKSVIENAFEEAVDDILEKDPEYFSFYDDLDLTESKKKFQEDSLDDFDIDGKIAKDRASQPEAIKAFVKKFQESVWTVFSQAVSISMENAGLEYSKYTHKDTFSVYGDNSFGLNYKPGCAHRYEIDLGEYGYVMWYGQLYSDGGPNSYHPEAKYIKEVAEKIRQDIYQCVKDEWDIYDMTSKWNISFEDCFQIGSIVKSAVGGINSGAFYFKCSFKIPEFATLTENTRFQEKRSSKESRNLKERVSKKLRKEVYDILVDYLSEMGDSDYPFHKSIFKKAFDQWIDENADKFEKICQSGDAQDIADELYSIFDEEDINSKCFDF